MAGKPETARIVRVFVSSPGDVGEERGLLDEVVGRINAIDGVERGIQLELFRWEKNVVPRIGPPPQKVVDGQTPEFEIYLGIMAARFGTPTEGHGSGTEKEFRDAVKRWGEKGTPWILFYFRKNPLRSDRYEDITEYGRVAKFREELKAMGIVGSYGPTRGSADGFYEQVEQHLRMVAREIAPTQATASTKPVRPARGRPIVPAAYRSWLLGNCAEIESLGLKPKDGRAVRLNSVYVPPTTAAGEARASMAGSETHLRPERERPQLLLDLLDRESLLIPGAPGSGKTTFCRWVAYLACAGSMATPSIPPPDGYEEAFPRSLANRLPLLVRLREFWPYLPETPGCREIARAQLEAALQAWLGSVEPGGLEWADVAAHLDAGSALLILDGLDEIPLTRGESTLASCPREMFLTGLADALGTWVPAGNRVVLTSRPFGVAAPGARRLALRSASIEDLADPLRQLLIRKWFHVLKAEPSDAESTANDMIAHLDERPDVGALTGNPLLLTAMCIIYGEGKRLPQDKAELYDRVIDTVLHNRYPGDPVEIAAARNRLSVVAHGMHTGAGLGEKRTTFLAEATYDEIDRMLQSYRDQRSYLEAGFVGAVQAREDLLSRSGLILPIGRDRASFYHPSFQEFLAAEWIGDVEQENLFEVFVGRGATAEWQNTLAFLFGLRLIKSSSPERSIALLERLVEKLDHADIGLSVVVADCFRVLLGRGIRLRPAFEAKFRKICVAAIEREIPLRPRHQLALALGHLGDPRIAADLRDRHAYVEIPAGRYRIGDDLREFRVKKSFLIGRYPVTNSQYGLFIDERGYDERRWWSVDGLEWLERGRIREPEYWRHGKWNAPNQPVVGVSCWEAEAFCKWAGARLPEEYEWEAAARGQEGHQYPWGDEEGPAELCNSAEAKLGATSSVGMFPGSRSKAFGLEDMGGNVWEWCATREGHDVRVLRGGSWSYGRDLARAACRNLIHPDYRFVSFGFRVVCSSPISQ